MLSYIKKNNNILLLAFGICFSCFTNAQAPALPNHDIVVFDLDEQKGRLTIANPQLIAASPGYDNQPQFSQDGSKIYFTRVEGSNADIWQWSFNTSKVNKVTKTQESEYSAKPIPFQNGSISVVRVEKDGKQRLWEFSDTSSQELSSNAPKLMFDSIEPVGYYVWLGKNIAMFELGNPHQLVVSQFPYKSHKVIDKNIGRCLQTVPGQKRISYTVELNSRHQLRTSDFYSTRAFGFLPANAQDYVWLDSKRVISSNSEQLKVSQPGANEWKTIENLSSFKLNQISRLAISADRKKIAVVFIKS
ncbi:MAG: hypothetical protein OQK51_13550 [Kangiellaceae bacterium]|nr:hypothetical protein [Kangiellaceae bacterium]